MNDEMEWFRLLYSTMVRILKINTTHWLKEFEMPQNWRLFRNFWTGKGSSRKSTMGNLISTVEKLPIWDIFWEEKIPILHLIVNWLKTIALASNVQIFRLVEDMNTQKCSTTSKEPARERRRIQCVGNVIMKNFWFFSSIVN